MCGNSFPKHHHYETRIVVDASIISSAYSTLLMYFKVVEYKSVFLSWRVRESHHLKEKKETLRHPSITQYIHSLYAAMVMVMTMTPSDVVVDDVPFPSDSRRKRKNTKELMVLPSLVTASTAWMVLVLVLTLHTDNTHAFLILQNKNTKNPSIVSFTAVSRTSLQLSTSTWTHTTRLNSATVTPKTTTTRLCGGANDWYDQERNFGGAPWRRNKARTDIRYFLTQRSIQSFVYLLNQCREEHTVQFLEVSSKRMTVDGTMMMLVRDTQTTTTQLT
jgi:hypothetical protein